MSLAEVAGPDLTRQAVHLIETGKVRPSIRSLQIITHRLGLPMSSLIIPGRAGDGPASAYTTRLEELCRQQHYTDVVELTKRKLGQRASREMRALAEMYLGRALHRLVRHDEALAHLVEARRLFESLDAPGFVAETMDWESCVWYAKEDPRAVAIGEEALQRLRSVYPRRSSVEARILEHLGTFALRQREYRRALEHYQEARRVAGDVLDLGQLGNIYHGCGRCHAAMGDMTKAIEQAEKAVALLAVEDDLRPSQARVGLLRAENDLGMMLMRQGQYDRAVALFESFLQRLARAGTESLKSYVLNSLSELRQRQGRLEEALDLVRQSIELARRLDERMSMASSYQLLGQIQAEMGAYDQAERNFQRALAMLTELGLRERKAECLEVYRKVMRAKGADDRLQMQGA